MKIAVVTGASSGMGKKFVFQIADRYPELDEIWIISRRESRLNEIKNELGDKIRVFSLDLTNENDLEKYSAMLEEVKPEISILVNSSGFGVLDGFISSDITKLSEMISLNCNSLTYLCHSSIPYMKMNSNIINLASAAAFLPQPGFSVYAASKSYVLNLSRALNCELKEKKIRVTAVCPGPVKTEFFKVADPNDNTPLLKKMFMADPDKVVKKALSDAAKGKDMSLYGLSIKLLCFFSKLLPVEIFIEYMGMLWKK